MLQQILLRFTNFLIQAQTNSNTECFVWFMVHKQYPGWKCLSGIIGQKPSQISGWQPMQWMVRSITNQGQCERSYAFWLSYESTDTYSNIQGLGNSCHTIFSKNMRMQCLPNHCTMNTDRGAMQWLHKEQ